jgi:hypothetical protein
MSWADDFPRLTAQNHRSTSPATPDYNCVAWAAGDLEHWWQPGVYWLPPDWPHDGGSGSFPFARRSHFGAISNRRVTSAVQPVWWLAPRPRPLSP